MIIKVKTSFKSITSGLAVAGLVLSAASCSDDLNLTNPNQYDANSFWQTEANFVGNITAMMNQWRSTLDQVVLFTAGELRTDYYWTVGGLDGSGLFGAEITNNQLDENTTQFTNYANMYGLISNCNTFLYYDGLRGADVLPTDAREYLLGMIYGMRAYCYFQIHKMWGTGPIREGAEVIEGIYDELLLQKAQATPEEFLNFIKEDIKRSLSHFEAGKNYNNSTFTAYGGQVYWNKAATEMLAGEVYLWSGKVSTVGTNAAGGHKANPADVATAEQYFKNVVNNYNYSLMSDYITAINENGAKNTERIFGSYYSITEATTNWFNYIMYDPVTGGSPGNYWNNVETDGFTPSPHGTRLTYQYNPGEENVSIFGARTQYFQQRMTGQNRYQSRNAFYYQFDPEDQRTAIFMPLYCTTQEERDNNIRNIETFDYDAHFLAGCYIAKYRGELNTGTNVMVGSNYMTYYRLAHAYAYLAEIANFLGKNAEVEEYINKIRARAYGENWDVNTYGYKAGTFAENEVAILQEKTKEFFQEGQRWWDLRRMTIVKEGEDKDHLVFRPEGCIGWGLDVASHPEWNEVSTNEIPRGTNLIETNTPVLDYNVKAYMVLWPLNKALFSSDKSLMQTPGYVAPEGTQHW